MTLDHGLQPVIWAGYRSLTTQEHCNRHMHPVRIPADALGKGVPLRDLYVSPNHRIALKHVLCAVYFGTDECLVAAKHLNSFRGIRRATMSNPVNYHHLLLGSHQVIWADGAPTESFHPAHIGLESFDKAAQEQITKAIGAPRAYGPTVRKVLKCNETGVLMSISGADPLTHAAPSELANAL